MRLSAWTATSTSVARRSSECARTLRRYSTCCARRTLTGFARRRSPASTRSWQLAWLLVQPSTTLPAPDAAAVGRVEQDKDALIVAKLARRFTALVRGCNAGNQTGAVEAGAELDAWLVEADGCGVPTMEMFAARLRKDGDAIRTALTTPWSNGQTEGQVNRLKLVKRQMYGHASFGLLRRRVLLAA